MQLPIEIWLSQTWPLQKKLIGKLPFVATEPELIELEIPINPWYAAISTDIRVDFPSKGPLCKIKPIESVRIMLFPEFPARHPMVLVRHDFPAVPHLADRMKEYRYICLTRRDTDDWWCGKTLVELTKHVYNWLCDAAAGKLVKVDEPFEPLITSGKTPVELRVDSVRSHCLKGKGTWKTKSAEILIPDGCGSRLIVRDKAAFAREGDIPTQVWYQAKEQSELWIDPPTSEETLINMMSRVGFDKSRVEYWIDRSKNNLHLLIVVGIKRPCNVLGRVRDEEWIAFELKRHKTKERCRWNIETRSVLESFSSAMAKSTSGFETIEKKVVLVGAGSLGSEIIESLARSGIARLTIIDHDTVRPHNLARHTLGSEDIGKYKAGALAEKINKFYPEADCVAINNKIFDIPRKEIEEVLTNAHCLIDCSASVAVQGRLGDLFDKEKPTFSVFQIAAGKGTIFIYSPDTRVAEPSILEAILITKLLDQSIISEWLEESADVLNLGAGCAAVTSKIPNSIVKLGAGWLADKILRILERNKWPEKPYVELLEYDPNTGIPKIHKIVADDISVNTATGWHIVTPGYVITNINKFSESALPNETGGILIGRLDRQRQVVYVTDVWKAPEDSCSTRTGFSRGLAGLKNRIAMLEKDTNEYLSYVGEWHSHPPSTVTTLSSVDSQTAKRMAQELEEDRIPAVCLITNTQSWVSHVVENV